LHQAGEDYREEVDCLVEVLSPAAGEDCPAAGEDCPAAGEDCPVGALCQEEVGAE
jgi:hypothetical protein